MKDFIRRFFPDTDAGRFMRFIVVGGLNTMVGYLLFGGMVLASVHPQKALAVAFAFGVVWNFFTHGRFVFGSKKYSRLPAYAVCYVGIYLFNSFGLRFALSRGLSPLLAQAFLAPAVAILSFFLISRVLTGRFPLTNKP